MGASYEVIFIRDWLEFSIAFVSLICSLLTLIIIKKLKTWNGNLLLITTLTLFQICYDINFLFGISSGYATCVLWHFLDVFGGLGVAFTTNVISFTVSYVVSEIASVNIIENFKYFLIYILLIPFVIAILATLALQEANVDDDEPFTECVYNHSNLATFVENFYYWSRIISIILNIGTFIFVTVRINQLGFVARNNEALNPTVHDGMTLLEKKTEAVKALARRMKYYPVAQIIIRCGSAWNEFENYRYSNNASTLMSAICSSFSGTAYFLVFLIMQPKALLIFFSFFPDWLQPSYLRKERLSSSITSAGSSNFTTHSNLNPSNSVFPRIDAFEDSALEEILNSGYNTSVDNESSRTQSRSPHANSANFNPVLGDRVTDTYQEVIHT